MKILVINCGSSSLKFQLINSETEAVIAKGLCERIGMDGSQLIYTPAGGEKQVTVSPMESRPSMMSQTTSMPASVLPVVWLALKS